MRETVRAIAEKICRAGQRMKNGTNVTNGVKRQEFREREEVMERRIIGRDEMRRMLEREELERRYGTADGT